MRRIAYVIVAALVVFILAPSLVAQTGDANKVLADTRAALGGEKKLSAVKTFAASGTATRVTNNQSMPPADVETAFELPDKFMKKDVLAVMGSTTISRTSGFNGETPINVIDQPPAMGGQMIIRMGGPGEPPPGTAQTPEQQEEKRKQQVLMARQDYARFALGMLLPSLPSYPLTFAYGGQAESPDGKADIIDVSGDGDFKARLFIDAGTHMPLMLSWMAKEPLVMTRTVGGPGGAAPPQGGNVTFGGAGGGAQGHANLQSLPPEERERMQKQAEQAMKDAEANRRMVEYRIYYGDYREVDGIKVPFRIQRSIAGKPAEELAFEKVKINGKIDPKKFETR
jgi:hypothetical protein